MAEEIGDEGREERGFSILNRPAFIVSDQGGEFHRVFLERNRHGPNFNSIPERMSLRCRR